MRRRKDASRSDNARTQTILFHEALMQMQPVAPRALAGILGLKHVAAGR